MINLLMVIAAGIFVIGIMLGLVVVVSVGIRREERREGHFFQAGRAPGLALRWEMG
jgi:hypothetical protein